MLFKWLCPFNDYVRLDTGYWTMVRGDPLRTIDWFWFILYYLLFIRSFIFFVLFFSTPIWFDSFRDTQPHSQSVSVYLNVINLVRSINVINDFIFTCPQKFKILINVWPAPTNTHRHRIVRHSIILLFIICTLVHLNLNALHASIIDS